MITMTIWVLVKLVGCIYQSISNVSELGSETTGKLFEAHAMFGLNTMSFFGEIPLNLNKYYHPAQVTTIGYRLIDG